MSLTQARATEIAQGADVHSAACPYPAGKGAWCSADCPGLRDHPEYRCRALHGAGGQVADTGPPRGPCPGHPTGYSPRLRELASLGRDELALRYIEMVPPYKRRHAAVLSRDRLMAEILEAG